VWLDGRTIGGYTKPNFSPGRTSNFELQILTSTKQLNQQRLSADGILIPHLTASPDRWPQFSINPKQQNDISKGPALIIDSPEAQLSTKK